LERVHQLSDIPIPVEEAAEVVGVAAAEEVVTKATEMAVDTKETAITAATRETATEAIKETVTTAATRTELATTGTKVTTEAAITGTEVTTEAAITRTGRIAPEIIGTETTGTIFEEEAVGMEATAATETMTTVEIGARTVAAMDRTSPIVVTTETEEATGATSSAKAKR